ncbi:hypothetical protein HanIR_Chr01g0029291 [Helianthus annuus]|nr:hypothetical protein HanIR_Chr01g0029291 [Helianthus annuus]
MYFRKLTDLARYARIFKLRLNKEVIQGLEGVTSSWTGYISLNLVFVTHFVIVENGIFLNFIVG